MPEPFTPRHDEQIADLQAQVTVLKQEDSELRLRLQTCEKSAKQQSHEIDSDREHRLLEATAMATNALLTVAPFDVAVNIALQILGESLETDRINLIKTVASPSNSAFPNWQALKYEWTSFGTVSQFVDRQAAQGSYADIPEIYEPLHQGQPLSFLIEDVSEPFRNAQREIGVKATHAVPIFIGKKWWGTPGFDDCREAKRRSAAELAVLKIAADCIGSAIERERDQQALLQAKQARSRSAVQHSQALERHNTELQQTLDRLADSEHRYRTLFELT